MRWSPALVVFVLAALAPGSARAEDPEALRLFVEGRALADQGKFAEACALFARSYERERAAGTVLNLADCAEREGKLRRAWLLYEAAAAEYERTQKPARARFAQDRANALTSKLATVVLRIAEPHAEGLTVRIGDHAAPPAAEIIERFDAGPVPILVGAPGREPFSTTANAPAGDLVIVDVPALRATGSVGARRPDRRPDQVAAGGRRRSRVMLAAGMAGAGALALGASGVLAWSANRLHDEQFRNNRCIDRPAPEPSECLPEGLAEIERARTRGDIATIVGIGGGVLLAAGALLYYTAPRERVTIAPVASAHALGLALGGRF